MESKNSKHVLITEAPCLVILPQVMESTCTAKPCYCKSKSRFFAEAGKYFWLDYPLCYRGCFCAMLDLICKYSDAGPTWACGLLKICSWSFLFRLPAEKKKIGIRN